jgi:hypothetical protein
MLSETYDNILTHCHTGYIGEIVGVFKCAISSVEVNVSD